MTKAEFYEKWAPTSIHDDYDFMDDLDMLLFDAVAVYKNSEYEKGYSKGYDEGFDNADDATTKRLVDAYNEGYDDHESGRERNAW